MIISEINCHKGESQIPLVAQYELLNVFFGGSGTTLFAVRSFHFLLVSMRGHFGGGGMLQLAPTQPSGN